MSEPASPVSPRPPTLRQQVAGNFSAQAASFALSAVLGATTTVVLARWLGPEGFGGFKFLFAFIYFFQTLNDLGLSTTLVRDLAQKPARARELVQHTLGLKIVMSGVSLTVAWIAAATWPDLTADVRWSVAVFALILPIQALTLPIVTLHARVQIARASLVEVVNRVTGFACMMAAVWLGYGLLTVTAALVVGELAGLATVIATTHRFVPAVPAFNTDIWKQVIRASVPLGMSGLLVSLVNRVDFLMLQLLLDDNLAAVGYYGTAYQVTSLFERLPLFVMATLYPVMSRLAAEDPVALASLYHRSVRKFAIMAVPIVLGVMLLAPLAVYLLGGPAFSPAVTPLRILIWSTGLLYPALVAGNVLIALGQSSRSLRAWMMAAPINVLLNFVFIPRYGASGAAVATVASFLVVFIASMGMVERALRESVALHQRLTSQAMPAAASSRIH